MLMLNFVHSIFLKVLSKRDIFGLFLDTEIQHGLVDSENEADFREKLEVLKSRWDALERQHRFTQKSEVVNPEFHRWFVEQKADIMARCMLRVVREKAGMGHPPDHFYTNLSESINSTLKNRMDFKPHDVRPFIDKVYGLVEAQENHLRKSCSSK